MQRGSLPSNFHRSSRIHSAWTSKLILVVRGCNYTIWFKQQDVESGVAGGGGQRMFHEPHSLRVRKRWISRPKVGAFARRAMDLGPGVINVYY